MSFRVTLNAPTTIGNEGGRWQTTYLEYGKIYCMSISDTTNYPNSACNTQYHTTIDLLCQSEETTAESRTPSLRDDGFSHGVWTTPECTDLPILRYVPHTDVASCCSSNFQVESQNATPSSFSVAWASNPVTGGRYCLLQITFREPTRGRNDHPSRLLAIRAKTQRTMEQGSGKLCGPIFEECFAQVQMFQPEEATTKILDDIQSFHESVERLQNLLRQLGFEIDNLHNRRAQISKIEKLRSRHVTFGSHVPQEDLGLDKEAMAKSKAIGDIEANFSSLQAILSSVHPVTMFRHHAWGGHARRPLSEMIDSHQISWFQSPPEDAVTVFTPHTNVNAAVYIVVRLLQSSALLTDVDANTSRSSMAQMKLQRWLNTIVHTFNEIHRSKNTILALKTEGSSQQDNNMRSNSARPASDSILPKEDGTKFQFYVRATDDSQASHRAIFIQERTVAALIEGILEKIPAARQRTFVLYVLDSDGLRHLVDAEVLSHLPDGQDLVLDLTSAALESMSVSPSEPCSSLESLPYLEIFDHQSLDERFDFDTPVTDISYPTQSDMDQMDPNLASIYTANSLDLASRSSNCSDINGEHQICASTSYSTPISAELTWQDHFLPDLEGSWEEMVAVEDSDVKLEADPTLNRFLSSGESLQLELSRGEPKPKQAKGRVRKSTAKRTKRHAYDREGISEEGCLADQKAIAKRRVSLDKNKDAAARCRIKKKEVVRLQNEELQSKVQQNLVLVDTVVELRAKAQWMAMMLAEHQNCVGRSG